MVNPIENIPFSQILNNDKLSNKKFQKNVQTSSLENLESGKQPANDTSSINSLFQGAQGNKIQFETVDQETIIKIMDGDSGDIIRQIPPEELIKMKSQLEELQAQFVDVYA